MHRYFDLFNKAYLSLFLDEVIKSDSFDLCLSHSNKRIYWNGVNKINIKENEVNETIVDFELLFSYHTTKSSIWLTSEDKPSFLENAIKDKGYSLKGVEQWLRYEKKDPINIDYKGLDIVEVKNDEELEDFIRLFDAIWGMTNPGYSNAIREKIFDERYRNKSKIFNGYKDGKVVTIGGFVMEEGTSFMHSIATDEKMRKKGYAKAMTMHLMNITPSNEIILQIEDGSELIKKYENSGFTNLMVVKYYSKD